MVIANDIPKEMTEYTKDEIILLDVIIWIYNNFIFNHKRVYYKTYDEFLTPLPADVACTEYELNKKAYTEPIEALVKILIHIGRYLQEKNDINALELLCKYNINLTHYHQD